MIQVNPSWAFSAVLVALLALFVGLSALAFWLALVAEDRSPAGKSTANAPSE